MRETLTSRVAWPLGIAVAVAAVACAVFCYGPSRGWPVPSPSESGGTGNSAEEGQREPVTAPHDPPPGPVRPWQQAADEHALVERGWDEPAARAVVAFHAGLLQQLHEQSPADHDDVIRRFGRLGGPEHADARSHLVDLPELAALMANVAEIDGDAPGTVAAVVRDDPDAPTVIAMFALAADPRDAVRLLKLLSDDRQLLLALAEHDSLDLAFWMEPSDIDPAAAALYRAWVRDLLRAALRDGSGEALDRMSLVLAIHADPVCRLLDGDAAARDAFADSLVPRFEAIIADVPDDGFQRQAVLADPRIWSFLLEYPHQAEDLLGRVGPLAIDVLLDPRFRDVEPQLVGLFRHADTAVVDGLLDERVRDDPRFIDFLQRPMADETRARGLRALALAPSEAGNALRYWASLDSTALEEEMADPPSGVVTMLPGYATMALLRKSAQGRTVSMWDVGLAGLDMVETLLLVKGGGATLKMVGAKARNAAAASVGRRTAERMGRETARKSVELLPWILEAGHSAARRAVAEARNRLVIDATPIVRGMYARSGLGRNTFRLIDGLDARIFMRSDRRVVIDLAGDHAIGRYLRETAKNAGRVVATEGDPTGGTLVETAEAVLAARENSAAWWLLNGDDGLQRGLRGAATR